MVKKIKKVLCHGYLWLLLLLLYSPIIIIMIYSFTEEECLIHGLKIP